MSIEPSASVSSVFVFALETALFVISFSPTGLPSAVIVRTSCVPARVGEFLEQRSVRVARVARRIGAREPRESAS